MISSSADIKMTLWSLCIVYYLSHCHTYITELIYFLFYHNIYIDPSHQSGNNVTFSGEKRFRGLSTGSQNQELVVQ